MANGVKGLLEGHLKGIDLEKNASIQDLLCAAVIELTNSIDGKNGIKKDIKELKDMQLGFFARLGAVKATVVIMGIMIGQAIVMTSGVLWILDMLDKL